MKTTEFRISDHIKTDEDVHNLLAAEREPYEKVLRVALIVLGDIAEARISDPRYYAKRWRRVIINRLKKEGVPDPTELKDKK